MKDKVIVITGASTGIGAALARKAASEGARVVLAARREDALRAVAAACGPGAVVVPADVTRREEVRRLVAEALAACGRIDVWVNNVGRGITRPASALTDADIDDMMTVNVKSALYGMQEVLPHFKERGEGHLINVSSLLGRIPLAPIRSAYCGAKHFLNSLTESFRAELAQTHPGIQVSLVSPGVVRTEFGVNALHGGPDSREAPNAQTAEEVAGVIAEVIGSRRPDVYTVPGAQSRIAAYYAAVGVDP